MIFEWVDNRPPMQRETMLKYELSTLIFTAFPLE